MMLSVCLMLAPALTALNDVVCLFDASPCTEALIDVVCLFDANPYTGGSE